MSFHKAPFLVDIDVVQGKRVLKLEEISGNSYYQDMDRFVAMEKALRTWAYWVETNVDRSTTQVFFLSISPTHDK
ncbi:unnamed protein product [Eruca vesicaria subsp. sativa]|uniref:Trichome birefringence-like C-terminal domain-containing protein n=1 Tax=Eruca vesicaria subsp. sativa TaxID=29727 RepID=A0ABC8J1P9_ERUVS|nr:unnamed protein product [Eruca vesicaria subsp. sativa]